MASASELLAHHGRTIEIRSKEASPAGHIGFPIKISHGRAREEQNRAGHCSDDWSCPLVRSPRSTIGTIAMLIEVQCGYLNYARRNGCTECGTSSEQGITTGEAQKKLLAAYTNTGDSDVGTGSSQFLVFRSLDAGVSEELLFKGASKLSQSKAEYLTEASKASSRSSGPTNIKGARPNSIIRAFLVRGRDLQTSWRYGFVEFLSVDVSLSSFDSSIPSADG